eukprot:Gb_31444 [translate_table: standard]
MEGKGNFSTRAFAWRSRNRNSKEKESDQTHGSFRKRFGELRRSKRSDEDASSIDVSDSPQSDSRRILMASSKLPCQAFGSAQSQVYPQDNVPSLNKRDRFSRSARQHGERRRVSDERRRMSDVGTVTERNGECIEFPRGLYKKFDMLSCSSRHPEMVCSMFNTGFTKESRGFIRDELQNHDISFLKAPADVGSSQLRRSEARTAESGSAEISQKCDNARGQGHRIFFASEASHSERFSQTASQDRKGVENDQCGKSGDNRLGDKYLKFSKHSLALHSTEEARSRTAALHQWLKHILKRKGSQSLKNEEQEKYHRHFKQQPRLNRKIQASDQALCRSAHPYGKDVQDSRMPEEIIHSSSEGVHLKRGLFITRSKTNKTFFNNQELMPQLQRSSSVPHSESCYMYQSIHADMPRRSEASAASLRRLPIIEFEELQTCESEEVLLPPRRHRESIHKRSFFTDKLAVSPFQDVAKTVEKKSHVGLDDIECLNNFLRGQRMKISNVPAGEESARVKIILSGPDLSLSSMVAAICYAWLLEYTENHGGWNPVPVINTTRWSMWEHRQVAWLFHHSGLDARALFFCDEVDLETLVHARQLNIVVIGQDALKTNDEVASLCTVLVEDYKGHAHDLLQLPYIRKLLACWHSSRYTKP